MGWIVVLGAGAAGLAQAVLLRRAARRGSRPAGVYVRLLLVAGVLVAAAATGRLAAGTIGWGTGFAAGALVVVWRWR
jgi:hypothetical protein